VLGLAQHSQLRLRESLGPRTIHEEVFEDELALASLERGSASAAHDLGIWAAGLPRREQAYTRPGSLGSRSGKFLAFRDCSRSHRSKTVSLSGNAKKENASTARGRSRQGSDHKIAGRRPAQTT
jgi:hypothetical protein